MIIYNRVFICPNSRSRMPYLKGYKLAIEKEDSLLLVWDRFGDEFTSKNVIVYRDDKIGMGRGTWDYIKFSMFVHKNIPDDVRSVVVFSSQALLFCFFALLKVKFVYLDIRDWHVSYKFIPGFVKKRIEKVFVSSFRFSEFIRLPRQRIVFSHNCWSFKRKNTFIRKQDPIRLSYIGSIRDFDSNLKIIQSLTGCNRIQVLFYGDGAAANELEKIAIFRGAQNVSFYGSYHPGDETDLYSESSMINSVVPPSSANNRTLLTNRLYNAVLNSKPLLVMQGGYLGDIVEEFGLGLVISNFSNLHEKIIEYFDRFDAMVFEENCDKFLKKVEYDMSAFYRFVNDI